MKLESFSKPFTEGHRSTLSISRAALITYLDCLQGLANLYMKQHRGAKVRVVQTVVSGVGGL